MTRKFDPVEIRHIGDTVIPPVAASYDELQSKVSEAKSAVEATFGSFIPGEAAEQFNSMWARFTTVAEESPSTIGDMGRALVDIADRYEGDEEAIAQELASFADDVEAAYIEQAAEPDE